MLQSTIATFERILKQKDLIISDNLMTIAKLTEGSDQGLKDIKLMFFSSQKELVAQIAKQREKFKESI